MSPAPIERIDPDRVDATTEEEIARQKANDDKEAMQDAARHARRIRKRLGLTQRKFSLHIGVCVDTIRNWEQGKRCPTGAVDLPVGILAFLDDFLLAADAQAHRFGGSTGHYA